MNNINLKDLDYLESLEIKDYDAGDDAATKVVGGFEIVKVYEPFKVGNSWIIPFISSDADSFCLGSAELEIDEFGGFLIQEVERELYCVGSI